MQVAHGGAALWHIRQQATAPCDAEAVYLQGRSAMQPAPLLLLSPAGTAVMMTGNTCNSCKAHEP